MTRLPPNPDEVQQTGNVLFARLRRIWRWRQAFAVRDLWWNLLDRWETHRRFRLATYAGLILALAGTGLWLGAYPWWRQRNAIRIARQWLDAGKLNFAGEALQQAVAAAPDNPQVWHMAAEYARRNRDFARALHASREAARLDPGNHDLTLTWASDAMLAGHAGVATRILASLPRAILEHSAWAQRIAGEAARRENDPATARAHFESAVKIEGPLAVNEVPLGIILTTAPDEPDRLAGLELLHKWAGDPAWGAQALRALLDDALRHHDRPAMLQWAAQLRAHPRCSAGDLPRCLQALSLADEAGFRRVLAGLEQSHAGRAADAAQLIGWLNQIGRSGEAVAWALTLPATMTHRPPVVMVLAESLRQTADWAGLLAWTQEGDWGPELELIRLAYALLAARQNGLPDRAEELWQSVRTRAMENGGRTLFAADALYSWGLPDEALTLWWLAAGQAGSSYQALGTLARHYQVRRDAAGQYRAFRQLHNLRADRADIANNFAFFAALTGNAHALARTIARRNFEDAPGNASFRATYAFVLCTQQHHAEAMKVIRPVAHSWRQSPAVAFAYGLALVGTGSKAEGRDVLASLDPSSLTVEEVALIRSVLQ